MLNRYLRSLIFGLGKIFRKILRASGTPNQIALGIAIGFFFGVLPIPGQYVAAVVVCTIFRANRVVAFFPVWLSNPATVVPLYTFNYWIGWLLTGGPGVGRIRGALKTLLPEMNDSGIGFLSHPVLWVNEWIRDAWNNVTENYDMMLSLGWEALLPLYLGCVVVGLVLALASYHATLYVMKRMAERIAEKRRLRHERVTIRLSAEGAAGAKSGKLIEFVKR